MSGSTSGRVKLPDVETVFPNYHGFEPYSYHAMLLGLGGLPLQARPALGLFDSTTAAKEFQQVRDQAHYLVERLPSQYDYFAALHYRSANQRVAA
ncbi:MAG: hypothetical protein ACJ72N_25210 [Labedaea sp.]